jgi:prolyl-tRNA synthetase
MMMQDGKALQGGTSHFLGQNFSKAADITYRDKNGEVQYAWTTSWGVTTRMIGSIIMTHGDDDGLILPPRIASAQIVIIPIVHHQEVKDRVFSYCHTLAKEHRKISYYDQKLAVHFDDQDIRGGEKVWSWIKKGVPIRLEIGPREIEANQLFITKRNRGHRDFQHQTKEEFIATVTSQLDEIQENLFQRALEFKKTHTIKIDTKDEFYEFFNPKHSHIHGGFALSHWSGDPKVEEQIKKDLNVTIRCIPFNQEKEEGKCMMTGKKSLQRVIFSKSY